MRWKNIIALQVIIIVVAVVVGYFIKELHTDKIAIVYTPPEEIAKWYKPESKRHVFLHTMFSLRREIQAINKYSNEKSPEYLDEWTLQFNKHYNAISKMVPSWENKVDLTLLNQLNDAVIKRQYLKIPELTKALQKTCDSCHTKYQNITALTYRTPDFSTINMPNGESHLAQMKKLTYLVNDIKINLHSGEGTQAKESLATLVEGMNDLGTTCINCHKSVIYKYPNEQTRNTIEQLTSVIDEKKTKEQARTLGTLAVQACATCHGTHKIVSGAKKQLYKVKPINEWHQ